MGRPPPRNVQIAFDTLFESATVVPGMQMTLAQIGMPGSFGISTTSFYLLVQLTYSAGFQLVYRCPNADASAGTYTYGPSLGLPSTDQWVRLELDLSLSSATSGQATGVLRMNGAAQGQPFDLDCPEAFGPPELTIGEYYLDGPLPAETAHYDNVLLSAR